MTHQLGANASHRRRTNESVHGGGDNRAEASVAPVVVQHVATALNTNGGSLRTDEAGGTGTPGPIELQLSPGKQERRYRGTEADSHQNLARCTVSCAHFEVVNAVTIVPVTAIVLAACASNVTPDAADATPDWRRTPILAAIDLRTVHENNFVIVSADVVGSVPGDLEPQLNVTQLVSPVGTNAITIHQVCAFGIAGDCDLHAVVDAGAFQIQPSGPCANLVGLVYVLGGSASFPPGALHLVISSRLDVVFPDAGGTLWSTTSFDGTRCP